MILTIFRLLMVNYVFLSVFSCETQENNKNNTENKTSQNEFIANKIQGDKDLIMKKIEDNKDLSSSEYISLVSILYQQVWDESSSENAGYLLFEYFRGNAQRCNMFSRALNNNKYRGEILDNLIRIMCIDLTDEQYTYEKLIKDFTFFKGLKEVKQVFTECISNDVY